MKKISFIVTLILLSVFSNAQLLNPPFVTFPQKTYSITPIETNPDLYERFVKISAVWYKFTSDSVNINYRIAIVDSAANNKVNTTINVVLKYPANDFIGNTPTWIQIVDKVEQDAAINVLTVSNKIF